ncbi:uncharacterized protein TRAVEDRAFT_23458 [Trametes versicolor FP-101664 SS1]|uniref:uncharacterized protein n=1 Tax=Trametes versicolor (strain FP-101664) TaxID=717944 RepID=UPI0004624763|nr:uncharacterized protein TRAVEDRAFT_23458 [Trametes versicolor FP-101664 SS1]EIW54363.1 hypothetical protein TRAVEDRAFT_23458 [Trametes versicolor FP-101664 SS1]
MISVLPLHDTSNPPRTLWLYRAYSAEDPFGHLTDVRLTESVSPETWARFRNRAAAATTAPFSPLCGRSWSGSLQGRAKTSDSWYPRYWTAHPLFALRNLTDLSLWLGYGEIILSDAVLEALRKHGPRLKCPQLEVLHIPHLYVPPEDCYDTSNVDGAEHAPAHQLWKLVVCRAFIVDAHACALVLHRIFPHLDVDHCRAAMAKDAPPAQSNHCDMTIDIWQRRLLYPTAPRSRVAELLGSRKRASLGQDRLWEPVTPQDCARFRTRAAVARTLLEGDPCWNKGPLDEESWSYLTRLSDGTLLLPSLRVLSCCPAKTGKELRLLASPCLQKLVLHHIPSLEDRSEDGVLLAVQDMLINTPTLTEFELHNSHGDFFTRINFTVLRQLKAVFHPEWFPEADELLVLAALPALERLCIELSLDREPELAGFHWLKTLHIVDGGHCTLYFLANCTSPHLRELTIDLTGLSSPVYVESVMGSELPPFCTTISQRFPQLRRLKVERESTFIADNLETFSAATRPLFTLRHLTALYLSFSRGALVLSNTIFEAFAEAWPALTSLTICVRSLAHSAVVVFI